MIRAAGQSRLARRGARDSWRRCVHPAGRRRHRHHVLRQGRCPPARARHASALSADAAMRISAKGEYAIKAMLDLAMHREPHAGADPGDRRAPGDSAAVPRASAARAQARGPVDLQARVDGRLPPHARCPRTSRSGRYCGRWRAAARRSTPAPTAVATAPARTPSSGELWEEIGAGGRRRGRSVDARGPGRPRRGAPRIRAAHVSHLGERHGWQDRGTRCWT